MTAHDRLAAAVTRYRAADDAPHVHRAEARLNAADELADVAEVIAAHPPQRPPVLLELGQQMLADSAGWFPGVYERGDAATTVHLALGLCGEAGEVADVIKKADICGLVPTCTMHSPGKHDVAALGAELADTLTYLLALAAHYGIDLDVEYLAKRAENVGRWGDPR